MYTRGINKCEWKIKRYKDTRVTVRTEGLVKVCSTTKGARQGCEMGPLVFSL